MLSYDVSVRPRTTPASIIVHGPWQIAATGLPSSKKAEPLRTFIAAEAIGIHHAAGQEQSVEHLSACLIQRNVHAKRLPPLGMIPAADRVARW